MRRLDFKHILFNCNNGGRALRKTLIYPERPRTGLNDSKRFSTSIYGTGKVKDYISPSELRHFE